MRRWHLFELGDQAWCPSLLRDLVTDFLQTMLVDLRLYDGVAPVIERILARAGSRKVVDLCSGAAGPWEILAAGALDVEVELTDKYPNQRALERCAREAKTRISYFAQ